MIDHARTQDLVTAQHRMLSSSQARSLGFTPEDVRNLQARSRWVPDDLQYVVRTREGHPVAKGDLAWHLGRKRPLIAEADGTSVHALPEPVFKDRFRGNALVGQACDALRVTFADSFSPAYIVSAVRAALAA